MARLGLFGKLPAVGDFVSRGFTNELRDALDGLLQAALMSSYAEGADRESLERSAPPVVINVRPGAFAKNGFMGCIVPSHDRVGRFFPLCVGLETDPVAAGLLSVSPLAWMSLPLSARLCQLALEAQAQVLGPDELLASLPDAPTWRSMASAHLPFSSALEITVPLISVSTSQFVFEGPESRMAVPDLAMCTRLPLLVEALGAVITSSSQFDRYFASRSMLTWSSFAALFDARWGYWGWSVQALAASADDQDAITLPPRLDDDDSTRTFISSKD